MRLIDHLHIHVVRHSLIITYYKPAGETEKHKVTIIITKDPDCTFDRQCYVIQLMSQKPYFPIPIGFLRFTYFKYVMYKGLGNSLSQIVKEISKPTLKDILILGLQLLDRFETLHKIGVMYRKLTPNTVMLGCPKTLLAPVFHLTDFSDCEYIDQKRSLHLGHRPAALEFCSIVEGSKKPFLPVNDIECLFYLLAHLYRGQKIWTFDANADPLQ